MKLKEFDESEKAALRRLNEEREKCTKGLQLEYAMEDGLREGKAIGLKEGKEEGMVETQIKNIKTMYKNGADKDTIARLLDLDVKYVEEALNK